MSRPNVVADELPAWANVEPWTRDALCAEYAEVADQWFPERGQPAKRALRICARCAVRVECLAFALENRIGHGVWGGSTAQQRRRMLAEGWTADGIATMRARERALDGYPT